MKYWNEANVNVLMNWEIYLLSGLLSGMNEWACKFSSTCKCSHENSRNYFWRPNLTLSLYHVVSAMQQLTIKMTLRHNFISIPIVDVSLIRNYKFIYMREKKSNNEWDSKSENINQLMTISKERINLNLLTPNRRDLQWEWKWIWKEENEGGKETTQKESMRSDFYTVLKGFRGWNFKIFFFTFNCWSSPS